MTADLKQLLRGWLDAVASGPAEAWDGRATDEVVIRLPFAPPGVASELSGKAAAIAALRPVWEGKERFEWIDVVIRATEDPELMVTTARSEVLLRDGRNYANSYVMLTRVRGDRVVEHVEYFNPLPVLEAYGRS